MTAPTGVIGSGAPRLWAGHLGAAWAIGYLLLAHLPILVLGRPILPWPEDPRPGSGMPGGLTEAAVITMLLGAVGVCSGLVSSWGRAVPRWLLLGIAWTGSVIGVAHWAIWSAQAAIRRINGFDVPPPSGVTEQAWQDYARGLDVVNLAIYEPWFLGMGILLGLTAWQNIRHTRFLARRADHRTGRIAQPPHGWMINNGLPTIALVPWAVAQSSSSSTGPSPSSRCCCGPAVCSGCCSAGEQLSSVCSSATAGSCGPPGSWPASSLSAAWR